MSRPRLSFRQKLTLVHLLIFVTISGAVLVAILLFRYDHLRRQFDARLLQDAHRLAETLAGAQQPWTDVPALTDSIIVNFVVRNSVGEIAAGTGDDSVRHAIPFRRPRREADRVSFTSVRVPASGRDSRHRLVTLTFHDVEQRPHYLQAMAPAAYVDRLNASLFDTLLIALPIAVIASVISTWLLAGRFDGPIKEMSEAAQGLSPKTIGDRIEVFEDGDTTTEVARLQTELNDALERLEEGFRAQEQFVANVAHDLKTPIAVVLAEAQTINTRARTVEDYEAFAGSVQDEMRRLGRLVESFLTLKRAEQGQSLVRTEPVNVNDVAIDAIEHCTPVAEHHETRLVATLFDTVDDDLVVIGDPDLLRTMLDNLIRNAIRFSPSGEAIDIRVEATGDDVVLNVRDRGPGIHDSEIAHLFDRYARGSAERDRAGGSGLGLAIAKSVAERHRGTIAAANCDDAGCVFTVRLPRARHRPL